MVMAEVTAWQGRVCASLGHCHALALKGSCLQHKTEATQLLGVHLGSWGGSPVLQGSDHERLSCIHLPESALHGVLETHNSPRPEFCVISGVLCAPLHPVSLSSRRMRLQLPPGLPQDYVPVWALAPGQARARKSMLRRMSFRSCSPSCVDSVPLKLKTAVPDSIQLTCTCKAPMVPFSEPSGTQEACMHRVALSIELWKAADLHIITLHAPGNRPTRHMRSLLALGDQRNNLECCHLPRYQKVRRLAH